MQPTIGRIVLYKTTELDQRMISEHPHNTAREVSPAIIVGMGVETVNLKLFIDGSGELYKKDVTQGDEHGQWNWPFQAWQTSIIVDEMTENTSNKLWDEYLTAKAANATTAEPDQPTINTFTELLPQDHPVMNARPNFVIVDDIDGKDETEIVEIPKEQESETPLVIQDKETGKHKAAKKPATESK